VAYDLTEISHPAGTIWLTGRAGPIGREARVVVRATDITLAKTTFLYKERVKLEIRADFFNSLNHAEFATPNLNIGSSQFGQISATGDPRIIQLAGRFTF
jgi:hypothetical protein